MRKNTTTTFLAALLLLAVAATASAEWEAGVAAFKAGKLDQAEREFEEVVAKQPEWPGGHFMLGQVLLKQEKSKEALEHLKRAYELKPDDISYQYALGQAYLRTGRYSESAQILKKINPASLPKAQQANYQKVLGAALSQAGDDSGALDAMRKAAQASPQDSDAWYNYGTAAFNAGDTPAGVAALEKAVGLDSGDANKQGAYAKALIRLGREKRGDAKTDAYRKAVRAAQAVVTKDGAYDNLLLLAEAQLGAKDYGSAVTTLDRATKKPGAGWLAHYYLSQAYTSEDKFGPAASAAREALGMATRDADKKRVWSQIGFVNEKLKNYDEAIVAYQNAGEPGGVSRVQENKRIGQENARIEAENAEIRQLEEERRQLEEELKKLPGGGTGGR